MMQRVYAFVDKKSMLECYQRSVSNVLEVITHAHAFRIHQLITIIPTVIAILVLSGFRRAKTALDPLKSFLRQGILYLVHLKS